MPLIHNVMGNDFVIGVSDCSSNSLNLVFNTTAGREFLAEHKGIDATLLQNLGSLGLSSIANVLGAIKYARYMDLGHEDVVMTVATDGADTYAIEMTGGQHSGFATGFSTTGVTLRNQT